MAECCALDIGSLCPATDIGCKDFSRIVFERRGPESGSRRFYLHAAPLAYTTVIDRAHAIGNGGPPQAARMKQALAHSSIVPYNQCITFALCKRKNVYTK